MNLGRHDKGFLLGRMIWKINNEIAGRENKLEIKKKNVPWEASEMATAVFWPKIHHEKEKKHQPPKPLNSDKHN